MKILKASFTEIDALCETVQNWDAELIPLNTIQPGKIAGTLIQAGNSDCQYMFAGFPVSFTMRASPPQNLITFNCQEPSKRYYWWRGHIVDSNMAWVFPVGGELHSICAQGFRVHTLSVTEESVEGIAAGFEMDLPPVSIRPETFYMPDEVLRIILMRFYAMRESIEDNPPIHATEILRLMIPLWLHHDRDKKRKRPSVRARDRAVRASLDVIESYDIQKLTPGILLSESHVSERTLQYAFRERFGRSPAAFLKSFRMAHVRSALRSGDPDAQTVGDIAAAFGFWHLGQFSTDYRRQFGEKPSDTLAKSAI